MDARYSVVHDVVVAVPSPSEVEVVGPSRLNSIGVAEVFDVVVVGSEAARGVGCGQISFGFGAATGASTSSPSSSLMMPAGRAMGSRSGSNSSASQQNAVKLAKPGAKEKIATLSLRPKSMVRSLVSEFQYKVQLSPFVRSPHLRRSDRCLDCDCAQCWGLRRRTLPDGT